MCGCMICVGVWVYDVCMLCVGVWVYDVCGCVLCVGGVGV